MQPRRARTLVIRIRSGGRIRDTGRAAAVGNSKKATKRGVRGRTEASTPLRVNPTVLVLLDRDGASEAVDSLAAALGQLWEQTDVRKGVA